MAKIVPYPLLTELHYGLACLRTRHSFYHVPHRRGSKLLRRPQGRVFLEYPPKRLHVLRGGVLLLSFIQQFCEPLFHFSIWAAFPFVFHDVSAIVPCACGIHWLIIPRKLMFRLISQLCQALDRCPVHVPAHDAGLPASSSVLLAPTYLHLLPA